MSAKQHTIYCLIYVRGGPKTREGWWDFFGYCMKKGGEGGQIFRLLHERAEKQGWILFLEINKRGVPSLQAPKSSLVKSTEIKKSIKKSKSGRANEE